MRAVVIEIEDGEPDQFSDVVAYVASQMRLGASASHPADPVTWAIVEDEPDEVVAEVVV